MPPKKKHHRPESPKKEIPWKPFFDQRDFDFVDAKVFQDIDLFGLPGWRSLKRMGHIRTRSISIVDAVSRNFTETHLVVSHRWLNDRNHPDPRGDQLHVLREFLDERPHIEEVWIDWCSLPQGERTEEEAGFFANCQECESTFPQLHGAIYRRRAL